MGFEGRPSRTQSIQEDVWGMSEGEGKPRATMTDIERFLLLLDWGVMILVMYVVVELFDVSFVEL